MNTEDTINQKDYHETIKKHIEQFVEQAKNNLLLEKAQQTSQLSVSDYEMAIANDRGNAAWRYYEESLIEEHNEANWCSQQHITPEIMLSEQMNKYFYRTTPNNYLITVKGLYDKPLPFFLLIILRCIFLNNHIKATRLFNANKELMQFITAEILCASCLSESAESKVNTPVLYWLSGTFDGQTILKDLLKNNPNLKKNYHRLCFVCTTSQSWTRDEHFCPLLA